MKSEKRIRTTIELYKKGKISLMRAAKLAEMDLESYKEELKERGVNIDTREGPEDEKEAVEERLQID